jgi:hypothetical protein
MFTQVYAFITHCLRRSVFICAICADICLRRLVYVYAVFTQCLRSVYAMITHVYADLFLFAQHGHLRKHFHFFCVFTHVYACLRMLTHIVRNRNYVYAVFTHVYARLRRLRTGQLADAPRLRTRHPQQGRPKLAHLPHLGHWPGHRRKTPSHDL